MKKLVILFLLISINFKSYSQQNDTQAALYNVGLGSIFGGIGAVINKKPNEKFGKVFLKGMYQGALGGTFVYGSKKMVSNFHNDEQLNKLWMSKIVNAAGISIIENAASNKNFWEKWHLHIGFNRIEFETKGKFKVKYKIMPVALIGTLISAKDSKFSLKYTIQTLTPIFITKKIRNTSTYVNSILIEENSEIKRSLGHEFLHTLQYDDFMAINIFFGKQKTKWKTKYKFINKQSKWIYMDLPGAVTLRSLYLLENINQKCYFGNYFEHEANYFSNNFDCNYTYTKN